MLTGRCWSEDITVNLICFVLFCPVYFQESIEFDLIDSNEKSRRSERIAETREEKLDIYTAHRRVSRQTVNSNAHWDCHDTQMVPTLDRVLKAPYH